MTVPRFAAASHRPLRSLLPPLVFLATAIPAVSSGAEGLKVQFDLPTDNAETSLKRFSRQSGVEVLFPTDAVDGIFTNVVQGEMTAREALDAMLAGTALVAVEGKDAASVTVKRKPRGRNSGKKDPGTDQSPSDDSSPKPQKKKELESPTPTMKSNSVFTKLITALAAAVAPVHAQTPPEPGSGSANQRRDYVEMSPFVVSSEKDTGYLATNTLAGTRLNTPIEDLGAAISIYTKDFLSDIGANDANELLIYATGMEAPGAQGNFSGSTTVPDINATSANSINFAVEPQSQVRTRGLSSPTITRNFFRTEIPFDSYNTERVTVNRGPNAILFGVGSPAGVVDTTLASADLRRNTNEVVLRYGNNDSLRGVLDVNRVLIPGKLAARLIGLYDKEEYNQRPAFEEKERVYGAVTFEPFRSTAVRANFETGHTRANRPLLVTPFNGYEAWELGGRQPFDWTFYDDPDRNPNATTQNAQNFVPLDLGQARVPPTQIVFAYSDPAASSPDIGFSNNIRARVPANVFHPTLNRDAAADSFQFLGSLALAGIASTGVVNAWWPDGQAPAGIKRQNFSDYSVFNWRKHQISETNLQTNSLTAFNIAVEQRALKDRVGVELAYNKQRYHRRTKNTFFVNNVTNFVRIDANVTLPTGEPNPNLGRPYATFGETDWISDFFENEAMRATAYLKYDFKDLSESWGGWLGHHTVTGLYEENTADWARINNRMGALGAAALATGGPDVRTRRANYLVYMGPSVIGNNNQIRLEPIQIPEILPGDTIPVTYFDAASNALVSEPVTMVEVFWSGQAQRELIKSEAVALQSYWLHDHLVTIAGWRRDRDFVEQLNVATLQAPTRTGPNDPGKTRYSLDDFDFASTPPFKDGDEITSYSAVLKWPKRLVELPRGSDLSVFYNTSQNFTPLSGAVDAFGRPLDSPHGDTEEYGLNFSAFGGKLNIRLNRFETSIVGQNISSLAYSFATNGAVPQQVAAWSTEANRNPDNVPFMEAAIARLLSPLPSNYMELRNFSVTGTPPNLVASMNALTGVWDTTDFTAKGTEMDIVFNPTRNWRLMANVANQETVRTNALPNTKAFIALMRPVWTSNITDPVSGATVNMFDIPRGGYPEGFGPANPPPSNVQTFGEWFDTNVTTKIAEETASEGVASAEQRKWRVNLVTSYTFGRDSFFGDLLKGWGVGSGVRWQSKMALGYPASRDADGVVHFDIANPYWAPAETNVDAWVNYRRKIWNERIEWKVQLNVRNLFGGTGLKAITVQPWGEIAGARIPPERRWYLTNTFNF